jgi:hypothetical protein
VNASGLSSLATFTCPGSDQFPFELSQSAQDRQHQSAMRGCGVGPGIGQGFKASPSPGDRVEDIQEIAG